jgi:putative ABC transport system permease protein
METFWQDLRYAIRMLRRSPGYTAVAVVTLALGIGANTAIFSVVNAVLMRPLPYRDYDRLVIARVSAPDFRDLKQSSQVFDQMAIWASNLYNVTIQNETSQVTGAIVSPDFFPMLGKPALGRVFKPEEDREPLAVLSHDFWQNRYGADPNVLGQSIKLSGKPHTIIGVMPPEFQFPGEEFKVWVTYGSAPSGTPEQAENRQLRIFRALAHLRPGISAVHMQSEVDAISQRLQQQFPQTNAGVRINFTSLYERMVGDVRPALRVLLGTVGFLLLIACANIANLALARMAAREREIAVRMALGAARRRVMRQVLTESLLLAIVGGIGGLLLAMWVIDLLPVLNPSNIPRIRTIGINGPVLIFTLAVSVFSALFFGVAQAWQAARSNLNQALQEGNRAGVGNPKGRRLRGALVVVEVALALVVLIGAGLLIKSFTRLLQVETGFSAENLLTLHVGFVHFKDPQQRAHIAREVIERVEKIPGIQAVGGGTGLPPVNAQRITRFAVQGLPNDDANERSAYFLAISPDYFRALGTPLDDGRVFNQRDQAQGPKVVIINRTLARRLFPTERAIGKRLQLVNPEQTSEWRDIVGVVGDVRYSGLDDPGEAAIYTPFAQTPFWWNYLLVRTNVTPESVIQQVRQAVISVNPNLEPASPQTMPQLVSKAVAQPRFYTALLTGFALLALALATVGIYGVISYSVAQRTNEIGIRMALGGQPFDVVKLMVGQGMLLAFMGLAIGLAAALGLTRLMARLLFGVSSTDPVTFLVITVLLAAAAFLASYIPARRAAKVDPMVALRYE